MGVGKGKIREFNAHMNMTYTFLNIPENSWIKHFHLKLVNFLNDLG